MTRNCYIDTETTGLAGIIVLIQYAYDDGPVVLHNVWQEPIGDTLDLIENFLNHNIIMFNAVFDSFHLIKLYTTFAMFPDRNAYPEDHISELAMLEERARFSDVCLKPKAMHDVMLHARKGKYQALMDRDDIKIRRVPTALAWELARELDRRIPFDEIFFARQKDKSLPKWRVYDIERPNGTIHPDFKDVKLKFKASSALKNLYKHVFKPQEQVFIYSDIEIGKQFYSQEPGYAPYARSIAPNAPDRWGDAWPTFLREHCSHWYYRSTPREYAKNDVIYTRRLYQEEFGSPEPGDVDSNLTWCVAACRWRGYAVDVDMLTDVKKQSLLALKFSEQDAETFKSRPVTQKTVAKFGNAVIAPSGAKKYILEVMDPMEQMGWQGGTKKSVLEALATGPEWVTDDGKRHPAAIRAQEVLDARQAKKQLEVYDKLLLAKRFHASFKVIGTLSSRMSGTDGLNAQGINHSNYIRRCFPLADSETHALCGGDFASFEVSLAAKVFDDAALNKFLQTGGKIHAVFAMELFPGKSYEDILATSGSKERDLYDIGKKALFAIFYGAEAFTLMDRYGLSEEIAMKAVLGLQRRYPGIKTFGDKILRDFGALSQAGGIGTKVEWREPKDYIESFLGFRRYFTLENRVMKTLFELAQKPPQHWRNIKIKVNRRERIQTASGAVSSALYGASFGIMSRNIRAAKNHCIQSPGAEITKATQAAIWELQPQGIHPWYVQPMNIHDELMTPTRHGHEARVKEVAMTKVAQFKKTVPELKIDWFSNIPNWADKKSGDSRKGVPANAA
jgi:hypothetical protein